MNGNPRGSRRTVLWVQREPERAERARDALLRSGFDLVCCRGARDLLQLAPRRGPIDVLVVDRGAGGANEGRLMRLARRVAGVDRRDVPVLARGDDARGNGAIAHYLPEAEQLAESSGEALVAAVRRLATPRRAPRHSAERIHVGRSRAGAVGSSSAAPAAPPRNSGSGSRSIGRLRERFGLQQKTLVRLAKHPAFHEGDLEGALQAITEGAAQALECERVGVWLLDDDGRNLRCLDLFARAGEQHESGMVLEVEEHPAYFRALETRRSIAAHDARRDERTASFTDTYLEPLGVGAMLDAVVRLGGRTVGVVCHEHVGGARHWELEERQFAGSVADLVAMALERWEHRRSAQALRHSRLRLSAVLQNLPHVALYETGETREFVSETIEELLGYTPERFMSDRTFFPSLIHPDDHDDVRRRVAEWHLSGEPGVLISQFRVKRADGSWVWVEDHLVQLRPDGERPYMSGVLMDITDRVRADAEKDALEEQLLQAQKMEAIGTLAGGIAHDFNNLLTGILGYASLLRRNADDSDDVRRSAAVIERAAERAADLTRQLLGFARKGKHRNVPVDLNASVNEVVDLLKHTLDKSIHIKTKLAAERALVLGDPSQLQQALLNLALNARDAMEGGGTLQFATGVVPDVRRPGAPPRLLVSVRDTGPGIPAAIQPRIFEPFFSTKAREKGTGMGLAMVYGIVHNHGCTIRVESPPGGGAELVLDLPLAPDARPAVVPTAAPERRGSGRILLVDDEEVARRVGAALLEKLGYCVVTAPDGESAVEVFEREHAEIDLVVLDMIMPRMSGRECFRALRAIDPNVRAMLSTGYSLDGEAQDILDEGMVGFAQKPYRLGEIGDVVAAALERE